MFESKKKRMQRQRDALKNIGQPDSPEPVTVVDDVKLFDVMGIKVETTHGNNSS